eukprot:SAG11_NODE_18660_length_484_cov_1.215584_1_plen_57_part_10
MNLMIFSHISTTLPPIEKQTVAPPEAVRPFICSWATLGPQPVQERLCYAYPPGRTTE